METPVVTRLSLDSTDNPGWPNLCALNRTGWGAKVFLDGVHQELALTADTALGWVRRYMLGPDSLLVRGEAGALISEDVTGEVRIELVRFP